jgi:hypothetical protein
MCAEIVRIDRIVPSTAPGSVNLQPAPAPPESVCTIQQFSEASAPSYLFKVNSLDSDVDLAKVRKAARRDFKVLENKITEKVGDNALHGLRRYTALGTAAAAILMVVLAPTLSLITVGLPLAPIVSAGILAIGVGAGIIAQVAGRLMYLHKITAEENAELDDILQRLVDSTPLVDDGSHAALIEEVETFIADRKGGVMRGFMQGFQGFKDCWTQAANLFKRPATKSPPVSSTPSRADLQG